MKRLAEFAEDNPWVFLLLAGWFAVESLNSFRIFLRLNVVKEATDATKDAVCPK